MQQSFFFLEYRREQNELALFADDTTPRYVTCATLLDYDTVAGADKFGNVFVLRLPETATADDAVSGVRTAAGSSFAASSSSQQALWEANPLRGAPHKVMSLVQFHIGEVATSLQKTAIVAGGTEVLLYGTVMGAVGAMVPFVTRRDVDFFRQLERQMRSVCGTLSGWDHLAYRSYYIPVKEAVDGDLCELFGTLTADQQKEIAGSLDRDPDEVLKKIDDMRQQCM
jgi:splicing factor 3B subunit 3